MGSVGENRNGLGAITHWSSQSPGNGTSRALDNARPVARDGVDWPPSMPGLVRFVRPWVHQPAPLPEPPSLERRQVPIAPVRLLALLFEVVMTWRPSCSDEMLAAPSGRGRRPHCEASELV